MQEKQRNPQGVVTTYYRMMARALNTDIGEKNMEKFQKMKLVYEETILSITDNIYLQDLLDIGRKAYSREVEMLTH